MHSERGAKDKLKRFHPAGTPAGTASFLCRLLGFGFLSRCFDYFCFSPPVRFGSPETLETSVLKRFQSPIFPARSCPLRWWRSSPRCGELREGKHSHTGTHTYSNQLLAGMHVIFSLVLGKQAFIGGKRLLRRNLGRRNALRSTPEDICTIFELLLVAIV